MRLALAATLLVACSVPQEHYQSLADVLADVASDGTNVAPTLTATPSGALAFGEVVLHMTSAPSSITITNMGAATTGALALAFDDATLGFSIVADMCTGRQLAPHAMCTFSVVFTPDVVGALATVLHVTGSPGGELSKSVSGTGLAAGLVDIVDAAHDYGSVGVDAGPARFDFTVRNTGQVMIGRPNASIGGDLTSYTIVANTCISPLSPSDTCKVSVAFDPSTVGQKAGSMSVTSSGGGTDSVILMGTGSAHVAVTVTGNGLVTSSQPGINCGTACDADFSSAPVTLSAQAALGSTFMGWGTDCTGMGTCQLDLTASKTVTATFAASAYLLSVTKNGTGTVTADTTISCGSNCSHSYSFGTTVTLTAAPSGGALFAGWSGDCSGSASCTVTMDRARNVTATFTTTTHVLTVAKAGAGGGTVTSNIGGIVCGSMCSDTYAENATVILMAMADPGSVTTWANCNSQTSTTCTVTMAAATTVTATFTPGLFALDVAKSGTGTVTSSDGNIACGATCSHNYAFSTSITLTAAASGGSVFDHWSGDVCNNSTSPTCAFAMPSATTAVTAVFTYGLTVSRLGNGGGAVMSNVGAINCGTACTAAYTTGTVVTLTASGNFVGWGGDCSGAMTTCTVTMSQVRNVTATFSTGPQTLTVVLGGNGTGSVSSSPGGIACSPTCTTTFTLGQVVTLTATATGGTFAGWTGDCTGTGTCVVTMDRAHNVTATFSSGTQPLTVAVGGSGGGTVTSAPGGITCPGTCTASFPQGNMVTLTAAADPTSAFAGWTGDCTNTTGTCTVTMSQARSVTALFAVATRRLTVDTISGSGTGNITPNPVGTPCGTHCWDYPVNTPVTITAAADSGSVFTGWSGPCTGTGSCMVTMSVDRAATATFTTTFTLSVSLTGDGGGMVTGTPGGISCSTGTTGTCSATYASTPLTTVMLSATVAGNGVFVGWGGDCSGTGTCSVQMSQVRSVTAAFAKYDKLTVDVTGTGTVAQMLLGGAAGPSCGTNCTNYTNGSIVSLTANAGGSSVFQSWTGACAGQGKTCQLTLSADTATTAVFQPLQHLAIALVGNGTVTSTDGVINCGTTCASDYPLNTMVTLNASANPGSVFFGWSGGSCSGVGSCVVTMSQAQNVTATFYYDVNLAALGGGSITAGTTSPPAIPCTPSAGFSMCFAYAPNTTVAITEAPATGHTFTSWSGDCAGSGLCSVLTSAPRNVTANFAVTQYPVMLSVTSTGPNQGTVSSSPAGIASCSTSCTGMFDFNASVTLTATPDPNNGQFVRWTTGPCATSTNPVCTFVMPASGVAVGASFDWFATMTIKMNMAATQRLDTSVTSSSGGINCTNTTTLAGTCTAGFVRDTALTLTYTGAMTAQPQNSWVLCAASIPIPKMVKVTGSGDCSPGAPSGAPQTSKCSITLATPGRYVSGADVTCSP